MVLVPSTNLRYLLRSIYLVIEIEISRVKSYLTSDKRTNALGRLP